LSKHRRPTRLARLGHLANSPLQLSIAAGVAGTLSVTGTVVASAADSSTEASHAIKAKPVAAVPRDSTDLFSATAQLSLRHALTSATDQRRHDLARAKARAEARRERPVPSRAGAGDPPVLRRERHGRLLRRPAWSSRLGVKPPSRPGQPSTRTRQLTS